MQTKQLIFGLACYSLTISLHAYAENDPPIPKAKTAHTVSLTPPPAVIPPKKAPVTFAKKEVPQKPAPKKQETEEDCLENPSSFRLSVKHIEANGIGYDQGYSSVDAFFAFTSIQNWHPFFDIRTHFFNDGLPAANVGFGIRYQPDEAQAIIGINGFFDFRRTHHSTFEQAGVGIEVLGTKWEFRGNGYFPIINRNNLYEVAFTQFAGHQALFSLKRELAFKGFDLSLGRTLLQKQFYSLSAVLGGYMFFADFNKQASGGLFKLKTNISRYFSIEGQTSYDNLFKGIAQGQVALNIPFGKKIKARKNGLSCKASQALADRLVEEVDRFEIIVTDHHNTQTVGLDVRTRNELYIVFVDNTSPSGGNGTAEAPYNTLLAAQNNSSAGNMIYVYSGNENTTGQDAGITLQNDQWLQGSVKPFPVFTSFGGDIIPAQTTSWTTIGNTVGDTITLANGNVITGFNIIAKSSGISGTGITDLLASYNNILGGTAYDISLLNAAGTISITNNATYSQNGLYLSTSQNVNLLVQNNTFSNVGSQNLHLEFKGSSNSNASIEFNTFQFCQDGSTISTQNSSNLIFNIGNNQFINTQSSADYSLQLTASASSRAIASFRDNLFSSPALSGLSLVTTGSAGSAFYLLDNTGTYTGSSSTIYPFEFLADTNATTTLLMEDNTANASGYLINNASSSSTFIIQSPNLSQSGVESLNTGSFTVEGNITYISFTPSSIPSGN